MVNNKNSYRRFIGYQKTKYLWTEYFDNLHMFFTETCRKPPSINKNLRLGKLVEQFVFHEIDQDERLDLTTSNIQIFNSKITIGELDCIIADDQGPIHIEIIYKFYLYDPQIKGEINRWIGPNRNDSLVQKISKLKNKQLPLLHRSETKATIKKLDLSPSKIRQKICFKAQLFTPFNQEKISYDYINTDCIIGKYIRKDEIVSFKKHKFYIPSKLDWLIIPHNEVPWLDSEEFSSEIEMWLSSKKSPLCWIKSPEEILEKIFIVWW